MCQSHARGAAVPQAAHGQDPQQHYAQCSAQQQQQPYAQQGQQYDAQTHEGQGSVGAGAWVQDQGNLARGLWSSPDDVDKEEMERALNRGEHACLQPSPAAGAAPARPPSAARRNGAPEEMERALGGGDEVHA